MTVKDVRYLLYTIHRDNPIDLRDFAIVYAILRLSLRVSEICKLKVSDIKKDGRFWVIDIPLERRTQTTPADSQRC